MVVNIFVFLHLHGLIVTQRLPVETVRVGIMLKILTCKHLFNENEPEFWYFEEKKAKLK